MKYLLCTILTRYKSMPYKRCNQCKKRLSESHNSDFCNDTCAKIYKNSPIIHCKNCNNILGKKSNLKNKMYCNNICHNNHQKKINLIERTCVQCNKNFIVPKSSKRKKVCSDECLDLYLKSSVRNEKRMQSLIKTNLEKYGVESTFSLQNVIEKSKKTRVDKYGTEYYNNNKLAKITKLEKYGTLDFSDQAKKTKMEKYGKLNFNEKANKTKLEKYGTLDFSDQAIKTKLKKYKSLSVQALKWGYKKLKEKYKNNVEFLFGENEYDGSIGYKKYTFRCIKCTNIFLDHMCNGMAPHCTICNPIENNISSLEKEILNYIKTIYHGNVIENDREILDGKELDIYIPELSLAIECNGIYWHGEITGRKDKKYHLDKTKNCMGKNIQLMHIWDWEWRYKKNIIKSILLNKFGKSDKIYARKCIVKNVSNDEKVEFLKNNHIQDNDTSSVRLGLYYNEKLVSLMTFVKSRYDKKYQYELSRYCNLLNTHVIGAASKLFTHFINNYDVKSIVTYSDKRLFTGKLYENLGMVFVSNTPPGYHYFNNSKNIPIERTHFQKHKLSKKLENFDPNLTEWENMKLNGYDRIWDCGHIKYEWNLK